MSNDNRKDLQKEINKLGFIYLGLPLEEFMKMQAPNPNKNDKINTARFDKLQKKVRNFLKN